MKIKINILKILLVLILIPILFNNCGTLGTIQLYEFYATKAEVDSNLTDIIRANPNFEPNGKWEEYAKMTKNNFNFLELKFLYYQSDPEEMVMISFVSDSTRWKTSPLCSLSIDASIRFQKKCDCLYFYKAETLESSEQERLKQRIEKTLLNKLKYYYKKVNPW